jgi:hypothetical protein
MDFDERIKGIYRSRISGRGECPETHDLIRYQQRELSTEDMLRLKKHIDVCGFCDYDLFQLSEFDSVPQANWKESLKRFLLHPALAYGIALALLYPAYRGLFVTSTSPQRIGTGSAMDFDLGVGSVTRSKSSDEKAVVLLSPTERFFILTFFVPVRSIFRYEMEIRNEQGSLIDSKEIHSRDSTGNFSIVAAVSLFQDGNYKLIVKEVQPANGVIKNEYNFHFKFEIRNRKNGGK